MDALGVILVAVGGFLLYAAVKGFHPLASFQSTAKAGQLQTVR